MTDRRMEAEGRAVEDSALLRQVLADVGALRREVADLRAQLASSERGAGLWESARELRREVDDLRSEVEAMQVTIAAQAQTIQLLQARPGATAIRWADTILLGVAITVTAALVIGVGGLAWSIYRSTVGAPVVDLPAAALAPQPHPHHRAAP